MAKRDHLGIPQLALICQSGMGQSILRSQIKSSQLSMDLIFIFLIIAYTISLITIFIPTCCNVTRVVKIAPNLPCRQTRRDIISE